MSLSTQASDWQVCGVGQVGGALVVGAGLFVFDFYSPTAGLSVRMRFHGVGIGDGGNASGTALPAQIGPFGPWSAISADKPFSAMDLDNAWGRVTSVDVGVGVSFGAVFITAAPKFWSTNSWFHGQNVGGFSLGMGAGAMALLGGWKFSCVTNNMPGSSADNAVADNSGDSDSSSDDGSDDASAEKIVRFAHELAAMSIKEHFDAGDLAAAIAEATARVKAKPADTAVRTFLFELLCFAGELDRAEKQLEVIGHQDAQSEWAVLVYRNLLAAERARRQLFADGLAPEFLLDPPDYVRLHLEAANCLRENRADQALELLEKSEESRPTLIARVNGGPPGELRDCDDLLAPILEVMILRDYVWLPYDQISELEIPRPERPRDLVWAPARIVLVDGTQRSVYLPALYHDSYLHPDDQIRLGRETDWRQLPGGPTLGFGLRTLLAGDDAIGLLDCRQIQPGAGEAAAS